MIKFLFLGFIIQLVTSFDDTLSRIPIIANIATTRSGRIAFSIGNVLAVILAVLIALVFSTVIKQLPNFRIVVAVLLFSIAIAVYFKVFAKTFGIRAEDRVKKRLRGISTERFIKLVGIGFFISFVMVADDVVALIPLFLQGIGSTSFALIGVGLATVAQIIFVIAFAERIDKIPHKKEIAALSLVMLGILVILGIL